MQKKTSKTSQAFGALRENWRVLLPAPSSTSPGFPRVKKKFPRRRKTSQSPRKWAEHLAPPASFFSRKLSEGRRKRKNTGRVFATEQRGCERFGLPIGHFLAARWVFLEAAVLFFSRKPTQMDEGGGPFRNKQSTSIPVFTWQKTRGEGFTQLHDAPPLQGQKWHPVAGWAPWDRPGPVQVHVQPISILRMTFRCCAILVLLPRKCLWISADSLFRAHSNMALVCTLSDWVGANHAGSFVLVL